jgi:hypothetical protein
VSNFGKILLIVVLVWVPLFEVASWAATTYLASRGLMYSPARDVDWEAYMRLRDPVTGWPPPSFRGEGETDAIGSRLIPAFPDPGAQSPCVSVYGDSFTYGDEVGPADSYPNALARLLDCRVNNFGQGGFGTDQALLRYREVMRDDRAPVVVLGHYAENIIRNVNQYRGFMAGTYFVNLKPRFVLDEAGALEWVPLPELTAEEFARIGDLHEELLPHEYFRPGGPAGVATNRFPHLVNLLRLRRNYRLRGWLDGVPTYAPFYSPDHESGALGVTVAG